MRNEYAAVGIAEQATCGERSYIDIYNIDCCTRELLAPLITHTHTMRVHQTGSNRVAISQRYFLFSSLHTRDYDTKGGRVRTMTGIDDTDVEHFINKICQVLTRLRRTSNVVISILKFLF